MTNFVIKSTEGRGYVALPGSRHSYTRSLKLARKFETREAALRDACVENERVVHVQEEIE